MAKVIAFINMKGGVGKTTFAVNVAYTLAKIERKRVLLIDMDPQMNSSQYILYDRMEPERIESIMRDELQTVMGFIASKYANDPMNSLIADGEEPWIHHVDGFDIIPSTLKMYTLNSRDDRVDYLSHYIKNRLDSRYDVIIIDCPPTMSFYTEIALVASDMYVVPTKADSLSVLGLPLLNDYIRRVIVKKRNHEIEFLGIILNMVMTNRVLYKQKKEELLENYRTKLFQNELTQCEEIPKCLEFSNARYIIDIRGNQKVVEEFKNITRQIMQRGRL